MKIICPWCGTTYTFGVVGNEIIGSGHVCKAVKECEETYCQERATFLVAEANKTAYFVCGDHIHDAAVVAAQPGVDQ